MLLALITLKYTQSNSVCLVPTARSSATAPGQQSRIHCTRLAADKADLLVPAPAPARRWRCTFRGPGPRRARQRDRRLTRFATPTVCHGATERQALACDALERRCTSGLRRVSSRFATTSTAPHASGVEYIVQPGGAMRDADIIAACDEHGMAMVLHRRAALSPLTARRSSQRLSNQPTIRSRRSTRRSGRPLRLRLWLSSGKRTRSTSTLPDAPQMDEQLLGLLDRAAQVLLAVDQQQRRAHVARRRSAASARGTAPRARRPARPGRSRQSHGPMSEVP